MQSRAAIALLLIALLSEMLRAQSRTEVLFAERVSQHRLLQTVRRLVQFGNRMGGTPSGDRSARYLVQQFRSYGLKTEIVEEPELLTYRHESWSLQVEQPSALRNLIKNEWLAGFSPSTGQHRGRLVYVDPNDTPDEGALDSLVVLTEQSVDQKMYQRLVAAGARCILTYAPASPKKYLHWAFINSLPASRDHPIPLFSLSYSNGTRLKAELAKGTPIVVSFQTKSTIAPGTPKTVVATLSGKSDEYFIVCAHGDSDSGGPGADDNASGVAGVLELARVLNALVRGGTLAQPAKTIKFIVWGSEYSSATQYVKQQANNLEKIRGVINYDEIGTGASRNCLYFESNDVPHNTHLLRTFHAIAEEYVDRQGFWQEATTNPSQGGTDSYVFLPDFLERLKLPPVKIPSVTIYTAAWDEVKTIPQTEGWRSRAWKGHPDSVTIDFSPYYHSSLDLPRFTTDREPFNMVWAVKAVGIALLRLAW
jgi:hypothetical protein